MKGDKYTMTDDPFRINNEMPLLICIIIILFIFFPSCRVDAQTPNSLASYLFQQDKLQRYTYQVIAAYPHDSRAFTQGLIYENGILYESTGLYGESSLRKIDLSADNILQMVKLADDYFAEGLTLYKGILIQLTWKSNVAFLYDKDSLELIGTFTYPYDGWGITHDGRMLITSDGSAVIRFLNPEDFSELKQIRVHAGERTIDQINELEYINGKIYANVWLSDFIVIIDPDTGQVMGWVDLTGLEEKSNKHENVLNGIAYDAENNRLFVTGKRWPHLYEIRLKEERSK